jgi:hypothetical protein
MAGGLIPDNAPYQKGGGPETTKSRDTSHMNSQQFGNVLQGGEEAEAPSIAEGIAGAGEAAAGGEAGLALLAL